MIKTKMSKDGEKICYTCLNTSDELTDLNNYDVDEITYLTKLLTVAACDLVKYHEMAICLECVKHLKISYEFTETIRYSQATLKTLTACTKNYNSKIGNYDYGEAKDSDSEDTFYTELKSESSSIKVGLSHKENVNCDSQEFSNDSNSSYCVTPLNAVEVKTDDLTCEKCLTSFNSSEQMQLHVCPIEVDHSNNGVSSSADLHIKRGRPKKGALRAPSHPHKCSYCEVIFEKRWKLRKHIVNIHEKNKKYVCTYCNKGFKQSYHLKEHLTSHTGEKNFQCEFCDKKFQRASSVKRHVKSHDAPPGQKSKRTPFLCNICGKKFPFSNGVQRHLRVHYGLRRHQCTICNRKFMQSTHLHVHMRTHTGEKPFICDTCGEAFSLKATLQKHISSLHNTENPAFICSFCGGTYGHQSSLVKHIKNTHSEKPGPPLEPLPCIYCGLSFSSEDVLQQHIVTGHTELISVNCAVDAVDDVHSIKLFCS